MPLVLVQNPVKVNQGYDWKDIVGEQYHFPNQYKNRCVAGTPFVYYRGTRRLDSKRAVPEYFGHGSIGTVWRDDTIPESRPKKDWAWYCTIEDYTPFPAPVPAKHDGAFLERIARNHWSVGIRPLPEDVYDRILALAGITAQPSEHNIMFPDFATISITETNDHLLLPRRPKLPGDATNLPVARYSRNAAPIGRRAEELAHQFLQDNAERLGAKNIRWVAQEGNTPGWDLQYEDSEGSLVGVEVKGTTGPQFGSIDITAGEWNAALALGECYWLFLVANCCTNHPVIQRLQNPAQLLQDGAAQLLPVVFRFSALSSS
jgi:hypothetical protein